MSNTSTLCSEDDEAMDVDGAPKAKDDELAEYNLDDYDDEGTADRMLHQNCSNIHGLIVLQLLAPSAISKA
jgi:hypothetical protein